MEPAQIDWKRIDSRFVEDVFYEHLRAPKWFDFLAPNHLDTIDDDAWFCKPGTNLSLLLLSESLWSSLLILSFVSTQDCNHPKRPEDFFQTPTSSKVLLLLDFLVFFFFHHKTSKVSHFVSLSWSIQAWGIRIRHQDLVQSRSRGTASWKSPPLNAFSFILSYYIIHWLCCRRRGHEDSENQNPNLSTPPRSWRAALKSSSAKKMSKETPKLKSTQSARNLFSGRDIFGHISEFCYELKRLATRVTEREDTTGKIEVKETHHHQPYSVHELELKKERKPLLEVSKEKVHESTNTFKENRRRKK